MSAIRIYILALLPLPILACKTHGETPANEPQTVNLVTTIPSQTNMSRDHDCLNDSGAISVLGSDDFRARTSEALDVLPGEYQVLVHCWLKGIYEKTTDLSGGGVYVQSGEFYAGGSAFAFENDPKSRIAWYAGVLVHEATHVQESANKRPYQGREGELTALAAQLRTLRALAAPPLLSDCIQQIIENIDDPAYRYWEEALPPC